MKSLINKSPIQEGRHLPGDFVLFREKPDWISELIEFGQKLRFRGEESHFAEYTHAAIIINDNNDIVEALGEGVRATNLGKYNEDTYTVVHISASDEQRKLAVEYAISCIGDGYGWVTIASIALCLITGGKLIFSIDSQMICSGLVASALCRTAARFITDPAHIMPADLAKYYNIV